MVAYDSKILCPACQVHTKVYFSFTDFVEKYHVLSSTK